MTPVPRSSCRPNRALIGALLAAGAAAACGSSASVPSGEGITPAEHRWFPIASGTHALGRALEGGTMQCESCHDSAADSFEVLACTSCHTHAQALTDKLHGTSPVLPEYEFTSTGCYRCHPDGAKVVPFLHTGILTDTQSECAFCHAPTTLYAALPKEGLDHAAITPLPADGGPDCGRCHVTTTWEGASRVPAGAFDPARSVEVTSLIPTYSGARISALTPRTTSLPMMMNHDSGQLDQATRDGCASCHPGAAQGRYKPGDLHGSLRTLGRAQPTACLDCHEVASAQPAGFIGPTDAERQPASGAMKHDAVLWTAGAPTTMPATPAECGTCHLAPARAGDGWSSNRSATTPAMFHAAVEVASLPQPTSCVDCHANSRPQEILDRSNATLPMGASWSFDHDIPEAVADCATCHAASTTTHYREWSGGRFHLTGAANPTTCLPCHQGDRPTSTANWQSPNYQRSPFDYVTNPRAITHGGGQDCAGCHPGPGTGAWGGTQNWQGGHFDHDPLRSLASTTCRDCHMSQRPDLLPGTTPAAVAALLQGFDHSVSGTGECKGCHQVTVTAGRYVDYFDPATGRLPGGDWQGATNTPSDAFDPLRSISVTALIPTFAGTSIVRFSSQVEQLNMTMDHGNTQLPRTLMADCVRCHAGAMTGEYYPGNLHSSLDQEQVAQPTQCAGCHRDTMPTGFVGPIRADRQPPSGEMKHDAVVWLGSVATTTALVTEDCARCHLVPGNTGGSWGTRRVGAGVATYHDGTAATPSSCLDCHANSRPSGILTAANAALPAGVAFDHGSAAAVADCASCHTRGSGPGFTAWTGGVFHTPGSATPNTCLPCHEGERPASTAGWRSTTYQRAPFDYVTNSRSRPHGNGEDCVACHDGPGTGGTWGGMQSWVGGDYPHGPGTTAAGTCIVCHTTQRPDLLPGANAAAMAALLGFDHAASGTGDCYGCHQATVTAGRYANYFAANGMLPGGDWAGGQSYPGAALVTSPTQVINVTQLNLVRGPPNNLIQSTNTVVTTYHNAMLHTSAAVPAAVAPGPAANPDFNSCWHCHQNTNGTVTSYADGQFHTALAQYRATPGGPVTPLPQPTARCNDCHAQMRPVGIVERAGSALRPMDHGAAFTAAVVIDGASVASAGAMDCSSCHTGTTRWDDGEFHTNIGAAVPVDCAGCHYPLMADAASSDRTDGTRYAMRHRSGQVTLQACATCHTTALTPANTANVTAAGFRPGGLHPHVPAQPAACVDCHAVSDPTTSTRSDFTYSLPAGATATNQAQWMSHTSPRVVGRDCADCHRADARTSGSAWSRTTSFHAAVPDPATCRECHGLTNGGGSVVGTNNNYPVGATDSSMLSTAIGVPGTGVPAGTRAKIDHADVNVTGRDCSFCHTQVGRSTVVGVQGREWAQASFHPAFTGSNVLVTNGTTGRCSHCHIAEKPGAAYVGQDHSAFLVNSGDDCASCHSLPGTGGTLIAPNWQGASGVPTYISVGGFTISRPPATAVVTQAGINNLPHPGTAGRQCTDCHATNSGGRLARGYDHASTLIDTNCNSCHEAGSDLVATPWNGATNEVNGAGDTRPITLTSLTTRYSGNTRIVTLPNHFYPVDCKECHLKPAGLGYTTTGSAYRTNTGAWGNNSTSTSRNFPHNTRVMTRPATCLMCHNPIPD